MKAAPAGGWTPRAGYALGFLTLISTFNYLDRSLLGLALPMIKREMGASDTVMGLVTGFAFVLFYSLLGVPIAWAADRFNRRNIIASGFLFWSLMTALSGFVANIWQLAVVRFLMGAGEACGIPPSNAMIADLVPPRRRPLALSIFGTAFAIASIALMPAMGWIAEHRGWRAMFVAAGVPGMLLGIGFLLTVREPPRGATESGPADTTPRASPGAAIGYLLRTRTYCFLLLGVTFLGANVYATGAWSTTFLVRVHHMGLAEIATTIGLARGLFGMAGILSGGILIDRLARRDPRWRVRLPAVACILAGPAELLFLLADAHPLWVAGLVLSSFLTLIHQAPVYALALDVAPVRMRATAIAIILFCASLLGQAIGPLFVGMLNDALAPAYGEAAIRYSLIVTAATAILGGIAFSLAAPSIDADVRRARGGHSQSGAPG